MCVFVFLGSVLTEPSTPLFPCRPDDAPSLCSTPAPQSPGARLVRRVYAANLCDAHPCSRRLLLLLLPSTTPVSSRPPAVCKMKHIQLTDLESELNALDARGYSVLHYTCLHSLGALVPVLLERGADVNLRTGDGQVRKQKILLLQKKS